MGSRQHCGRYPIYLDAIGIDVLKATLPPMNPDIPRASWREPPPPPPPESDPGVKMVCCWKGAIWPWHRCKEK